MAQQRIGVVLGLGEFGLHIARYLSLQGCDVIAADGDRGRIDLVKEQVKGATVADLRSRQVLEELVPPETDFVVVAIGNLEASVVACLHLRDMKVRRIIVKAINEEHERILRMLGLSEIVFPEKDMAERSAARLMNTNMLDYLPLTADYSIAEVAPFSVMQGKTLRELDFRIKYGLSIVAIKELVPPQMIFSPGAEFVLKMSDVLVVLGPKERLDEYTRRTRQ